MNNDFDDFYLNLKAMTETAFPKICSSCGKIYETAEDFLINTEKLGKNSGLKSSLDDNDQSILELYRNCTCGSTLMDFFSDRRDTSEKGLKRRALFEKLLTTLEEKGIPRDQGRIELLNLMRGNDSLLLRQLGMTLVKRTSPKGQEPR
jgi:hypothetical protein